MSARHNFPIRYRLERLALVTQPELPELPTIFDAFDVEDSRDDFLALALAFRKSAEHAAAMYRRAGIEVDTSFFGSFDDMITDCFLVPLVEHAQLIRDATPTDFPVRVRPLGQGEHP